MSCRILSTKKLLPETAREATNKNIHLREVEFISVKTILTREKWNEVIELMEENHVVVFTSSNAVESLEKYMQSYVNHITPQWKIYCLSGRTKKLIENIEVIEVQISGTAGNATELSRLIINANEKEIVFFCGDQRRDELPIMLKSHGISVRECIVYETIETPSIISEFFDAILFFSPSAVKSFFSANQIQDSAVCFAIGETTANAIKEMTKSEIVISKEASQESMMDAVLSFCRNK
jgi:uroporphyrinogen-III synthase